MKHYEVTFPGVFDQGCQADLPMANPPTPLMARSVFKQMAT